MPIIWRYLLRCYFQVFSLCVSSFIAMLLVLRFQDIARFATSGTSQYNIFLFTLLQIPYILPIAIPVSCLIASMILFQRLSQSQELTAFRTCGIGLKSIIMPLIFAGLFLTLFNFTIACEVAPYCRSLSKGLIYQTAAQNPLIIFQQDSPLKLKNTYVDIKTLKSGKCAEEVIFASKNTSNNRLTLMIAKELSIKGDLLKGKQVALISSGDPKKTEEGFDHLVIENQSIMDTKAANLTQYTQAADWHAAYEYSSLRQILTREAAEKNHYNFFSIGKGAQLELSRRFSMAFAALSFTLIGTAFGIQMGRNRSKKGVLFAVGLAAFYLICFITAKSLKHHHSLSTLIFLIPHPLIMILTWRRLRSIAKGVE